MSGLTLGAAFNAGRVSAPILDGNVIPPEWPWHTPTALKRRSWR
jgi:hypothetical protein